MQQTGKILLLATTVLLFPIVPFVVIGELPGENWLSATEGDALLFALTGGGLLTLDVVLPVPSSIVIALLGGRLGFMTGWLCAWLGLTIGNLLAYAIGKLWPVKMVPELGESPTLLMLFLSRPVPVLAEAVSIAAGATRTRVLPFLLVCMGGNAIYAGILAVDGATLLAFDWTGPGLILPMLLPVMAWLAWRWLGGSGSIEVQK